MSAPSKINRFKSDKKTSVALRNIPLFLLFFFFLSPVQAAFETPRSLKARDFLPPELLKSENYTVESEVKNDGLLNHYTVTSKFGTFQAASTLELKILLNQINVIAAMRKVDTSDVALESLKTSGKNTVAGITHLATDPLGAIEGAVTGIGSLFNRATKTVGKRKSGESEDSSVEQLVGISKSKGIIASKYGVNVYSSNQVLQAELNRLGQADFLGGLGVGVATSFVPGVGGLMLSTSGATRLLNDAINTTPATELWLQNKTKLIAMGVNEDIVELFLNNPAFNPARSTIFVAALEAMKGIKNRGLLVTVALQAANVEMAATITRIAVMTASYHTKVTPLASITPMARLTQGIRKDGVKIILLPVDYIIWSEGIARNATGINNDAAGKPVELWLLGTLSPQATTEFKKLGWQLHTHVSPQLLPEKK